MTLRKRRLDHETAEEIAIRGLSFLAGDTERLVRFLTLTGAGPDTIRRAKDDPDVLASILEYLLGDERLLLAFASEADVAADQVQGAWDILTLQAMAQRRTRR